MVRVMGVDDAWLPGVDNACRAISASPAAVRATMANSSPTTRHHTFDPTWPGGVE
jgi:hypothetical protein